MLSTTRLAINMLPALYPFECHTVAQQLPATSEGMKTGLPARSETVTNVSARDLLRREIFDPPKMRLIHAGK
jgi:hypothetical protein